MSRSSPVPDRQVLCGILYVLHTGIQWEHLPEELGLGSGMTCRRRLRDWKEAGVRQRLHELLSAEPNAAARPDRSRCVVDSSHVMVPGADRRAHVTGAGPDRWAFSWCVAASLTLLRRQPCGVRTASLS
ncbi:hypothetical protein GCM10019016_121080 [Streptomyces prasinosporus]|uniref:Insertion element IS402-like domain-containing protein n=1 Tax=Streptomyces prasinosporus TaxID=68256 RepID=A0ABP6UDK8_9ACTN